MRYWKRVDAQGKTTSVEKYSHDLEVKGATEITKREFEKFLASLPPVELPAERDLAAELDKLEERVRRLEDHE